MVHCFGSSCVEDGLCPGTGGNADGSSCENAIPITAGTYPVVELMGNHTHCNAMKKSSSSKW